MTLTLTRGRQGLMKTIFFVVWLTERELLETKMWVTLTFPELRSLWVKRDENHDIIWTKKRARRNSYICTYTSGNLPLVKGEQVSAVTIQTPPLLSKSGQCKIETKSTALAALISIRVHGRSYIDARSGRLNVGSRWLERFARYDTMNVYTSFQYKV
jgi:hypothetical protein